MNVIDLMNITRPPAWMARGVCTQHEDPDLFHPDKGDAAGAARAKQVCAGCPVRAQCLAHALDRGERRGVWGGESATTRQRMTPPAPPPGRRVSAPVAERAGQIRRLTGAGLNDRQVAARIGTSVRTVQRIRSRFAIPPTPVPGHNRGAA